MKKTSKKFYVVTVGVIPGIYGTWEECQSQTKNFPNAIFKSFKTLEEAESEFVRNGSGLLSIQSLHPIINSYCVDGSCSKNPGPIEYRCVDTRSGEEIFRHGFEGYGTNNISEFLAIVHALAFLKSQGQSEPVYSDSSIAIEWVKQKRCNTTLKANGSNNLLLDAVARAENWLKENTCDNQVLKWETHLWGEIPADFGRK
jgi:ribonuclease HI